MVDTELSEGKRQEGSRCGSVCTWALGGNRPAHNVEWFPVVCGVTAAILDEGKVSQLRGPANFQSMAFDST